jgi:hypothetical protein
MGSKQDGRQEQVTLAEALESVAAGLEPGQSKMMSCLLCGAVVFVQPAGNQLPAGDPERHVQWHRDNDHCHGPGA